MTHNIKHIIIKTKQVKEKHCPIIFLVFFIKFFALQYLIKLVNIIISILIISIKINRIKLATGIFDHLIIAKVQNKKNKLIDWNTIASISKVFDCKLLKQQQQQQQRTPIFL